VRLAYTCVCFISDYIWSELLNVYINAYRAFVLYVIYHFLRNKFNEFSKYTGLMATGRIAGLNAMNVYVNCQSASGYDVDVHLKSQSTASCFSRWMRRQSSALLNVFHTVSFLD
jgi:hypothetical protein